MQDEVVLLGRLMLSVVFVGSGISHLHDPATAIGYAAYKGVPRARVLAVVAPAAMLLGAVAIVFGIFIDLAALCLAVLVVCIAVLMHRFWDEPDARNRQLEQAQFTKTISLAGGCVILAAVGDGLAYTVTGGVF